MEKNTLSNYGWVVVVILVLSIMIALATPFAMALKDGFVGTVNNFGGHLDEALDIIENGSSDNGGSGNEGGGSNEGSGGSNLPAGGEVNAETGEILDSWEVIINNVNNGTYATKYAVGNYKPLDLGTEGIVNMQIAALDADVLSDSTGNAHITWIAKELLTTKHSMNSTNTNENGWAASEMRTYLQNDVWALIPADVQNAIVEVDKTYYDYTTKSTLTSSDKVWIPSCREVGIGTGIEDDGVIYSELFTDNTSRVKTLNGSASDWWLRSAHTIDSYYFYFVPTSGGNGRNYASNAYGVALSFCF